MKLSQNPFKNIERERNSFAVSGVKVFNEILPNEEGRKLHDYGIEKECSIRRRMSIVAIWFYGYHTHSFEEIKKMFGDKE